MRLLKLFLLSFFFVGTVHAQQAELIDRTFQGTSKEKNQTSARRDIQDQGFKKISEEIIKELIGEDRYAKNKSLIETKVIRNYGRYIPFSKPSALAPVGEDYQMSVEMKVSLRDLKQLLQDNTLLNENEGVPVVLPVVSWIDRVEGQSYRWWLARDKSPSGFLLKEARLLEDSLRTSFQKNNFYAMKPTESGLNGRVPSSFQSERIAGEDSQFFAQYFNAPVLIDGQVVLTRGERKNFRIEVRLTAIQVSNGRAIADVSRRFDTDAGTFENAVDKKMREVLEGTANDLASQVLEAWQRGSVGTSVLRLTIQGRTTLPAIEGLKERIRSQVTQVRNIRERLVSSESVSFEVDTAVSPQDLAARLEAVDIDGKKLSRVSESASEIILRWNQ